MDKSWFFDRVRACDRLGVNWDAMMRVGMQAEQDGHGVGTHVRRFA